MTTVAGILASLAIAHGALVRHWRRRIAAARPAPWVPVPPVGLTVVVPVRNGARTLPALLDDLHAQRLDGPHVEIVVVDDHSSDGTPALVRALVPRRPGLRLLTAAAGEAGKKAAITRGVEAAGGPIIVLMDADVRCGPEHLQRTAMHFHRDPCDLLLMPVHTTGGRGVAGWLQRREQLALQGVALGSALAGRPLLANGANLAFRQAAFAAVGGFAGDRTSSGDDMRLLRRMRRAGMRIDALPHRAVAVRTAAEDGWCAAAGQRLRWAGKMRRYRDGATALAGMALLLPWALLLATGRAPVPTGGPGAWAVPLLLLVAWAAWALPVLRLVAVMEAVFRPTAAHPSARRGARATDLVALALFMVYAPVLAIVSIFVRPRWKGRRVRT